MGEKQAHRYITPLLICSCMFFEKYTTKPKLLAKNFQEKLAF